MNPLRALVAEALATTFLSGVWHVRVMMARGDHALGAGGPWLQRIAFDVRQRWAEPPFHELDLVATFIERHEAFREAWFTNQLPHRSPQTALLEPRMGPARWPVKPLHTTADVAHWLALDVAELEWFADRRALQRDAPEGPLQHYRRHWVARDARAPRLIEAPKSRLKVVQRRVLAEVLAVVPVHPAAHGFVAGRSVLTHAALHAAQPVVVRFDLEAFFTWLQPARAFHVFRALGYPREVATLLLGLCTTRTPWATLRAAPRPAPFLPEHSAMMFGLRRRLAGWHLAQGAPTSPALANLTSWRLDARLSGVAQQLGAVYSRYADDLVFSGGTDLSLGALARAVSTVCNQEGVRVNASKTRMLRRHRAQEVTGLVVNQGLGVARHVRDALEAQLFNLSRGRVPAEVEELATLRARLEGQVGWVAHVKPSHATWLRELLGRVDWAALERRPG